MTEVTWPHHPFLPFQNSLYSDELRDSVHTNVLKHGLLFYTVPWCQVGNLFAFADVHRSRNKQQIVHPPRGCANYDFCVSDTKEEVRWLETHINHRGRRLWGQNGTTKHWTSTRETAVRVAVSDLQLMLASFRRDHDHSLTKVVVSVPKQSRWMQTNSGDIKTRKSNTPEHTHSFEPKYK